MNLYEPLFYHDADYRLKPFLAESIEPSKDGKTWLLKLRSGVEFHNGRTLDARDVIATLRRIVDPKAHTAGAASLSVIGGSALHLVSRPDRCRTRCEAVAERGHRPAHGPVPPTGRPVQLPGGHRPRSRCPARRPRLPHPPHRRSHRIPVRRGSPVIAQTPYRRQ
ncbi:ABC transporter substrate-binding protein [Streptomyces xiangluensis]|uniref:ABC transporter substrate-binding protein n=1 Tax=Streptomyces xiangluensis TaxID=2665720 RepID=A0ABV8YYK1_9ACTN